MSKIAEIDILSLEHAIPVDQAYGTSRGLNLKRSSSIVLLTTEDGVTGLGEASGPALPIGDYLAHLKRFFVGERLYDAPLVAASVKDRLDHYGSGHHLSCLSAIDVAVFDATGKTHGLAVHDFLGGRSLTKIPCYATTGYVTPDGLEGLERQLSALDRSRFTGVKIKIGLGPRSDRERVRLARRILGDDILLMADVNGNYTLDAALASIRAIEPFDIHWIEEPMPAHFASQYGLLRARSPIPIAVGEGFHSVHEFKAMIEAQGADILQPAVGKCGGLSAMREIAVLARSENLRVTPAVWGGAVVLAASMHFLTSLSSSPHTDHAPHPAMLEFDTGDNPLRDKIVRRPFTPDDGGIELPAGPGLGVEIDLEAAAAFRRPEAGALERQAL